MSIIETFLSENIHLTNANLANVNHLDSFAKLNLPKDQIAFGGSSTMALFGIRPNKDLEGVVTTELWNHLTTNKKYKYTFANPNRESSKYFYPISNPDINFFGIDYPLGYTAEEALSDRKMTFELGGYHFDTLELLMKWKKKMGRPKDLADVELIKSFLKNQ